MGGRYSEVVISTGLTVLKIEKGKFLLKMSFWIKTTTTTTTSAVLQILPIDVMASSVLLFT